MEATQRDRKQRLLVGKSERAHLVGGDEIEPGRRALRRQYEHADAGAQRHFIQLVSDVLAARQVDRQVAQIDLFEAQAASEPQPDPQAALDALANRQAGQRQVRRVREVADRCDFDWQEFHRLRGAEIARRLVALAEQTAHRRAARHGHAGGEVRVVDVGLELGNQHRRRWREKLWVQDLEQPLRETWEFGVELELHTCGQKGESLK